MLINAPQAVGELELVDESPWPAQVHLITSALEAGRGTLAGNRRGQSRVRYEVRAWLRLHSDPVGASAWRLYTRDVSSRGIGFLTSHRLPLGYGGTIELLGPRGTPVVAHCTVLRCREAAAGWYEGAISFNRDQWMFADKGECDCR